MSKLKEPPQIAIKFANTVFVIGVLLSILLTTYGLYRIILQLENIQNLLNTSYSNFYLKIFIFGIISAISFSFGLKLNNELKIRFSILFVTIFISIYAFEICLHYLNVIDKNNDTKTKIEVLKDLNDSGKKSYLNVSPKHFSNEKYEKYLEKFFANKKVILPLGGISNITTILNNESGYYPVIETDEHGFNNPKGLYRKNELDIVLTGDSFIEGSSVHADENISSVLRKLGFTALNVGKGGNGPLVQLGTLIEYAKPLKPKILLWSFYISDFYDLTREMKSSFLIKYLNEDNFSQNLISRQNEINNFLIDFSNSILKKQKNTNNSILKILKIYNLRSRINLTPKFQSISKNILENEIETFINILEKSKKIVNGWGGNLYMIYLPNHETYYTGNLHPSHKIVLDIANKMDIPIIDTHMKVFKPHPDPLSLFPNRKKNHYNAKGYHLVAVAISNRLREDGITPSDSTNY